MNRYRRRNEFDYVTTSWNFTVRQKEGFSDLLQKDWNVEERINGCVKSGKNIDSSNLQTPINPMEISPENNWKKKSDYK